MQIIPKIAKRIASKLAVRLYEAASGSGRWPTSAIMPSTQAANLAQRGVLAQRAAWLMGNTSAGESIALTYCNNIVADGPSVQSKHSDANIAKLLTDSFNDWITDCDIEGGDLVGVLNIIVRGLVGDGEAFIRLITTESGRVKLQPLDARQIDPALNRENSDGSKVVAGVQIGPNGERLGYWVLPQVPVGLMWAMPVPVFVPASEIMHILDRKRAGEVRGIPWLTPVMTKILELDSLEDAALAKAKVSALFAGFIRDLDGTLLPDQKIGDPNSLSLEPGTIRVLPPGAEITFPPTSDFSGIGEFAKSLQRAIAAGSGTPYPLVFENLSDVNYSSARVGLQNFWRRCASIRASLLVSRFLQPVYNRFVTLEILSGRLSASDFEANSRQYFAASFLWPQPVSIDPVKDASADTMLIDAGIASRQSVIAARGRDPSEVDAEIAKDTFVPKIVAVPKPEVN